MQSGTVKRKAVSENAFDLLAVNVLETNSE